MNAEQTLIEYYARRVRQYERVYEKPERQEDLRNLRTLVADFFKGKRVLEVACGTGYWTEIISHEARSITALDVNQEVLAAARAKPIAPGKATFLRGDVYALPDLAGGFDAGLAGFWWSHIPKSRLRKFLTGFHRALEPGARVMFFDNAYVEGSSTALSRIDSDRNPVSPADAEGNTYQQRVLDDGSSYEVLKNFPTAEELRRTVDGLATEVEVTFLKYYWILSYVKNST
jgi:demethylmenaquinone methyltransferase/2-methoxy-6-polyprenyl-1,4-benzoquinol methylase